MISYWFCLCLNSLSIILQVSFYVIANGRMFIFIVCIYIYGGDLVAKSWPTLVACSLPGSSVHGILQARILEWVAISFSRGLLDQDPEIKLVSPALQAVSCFESKFFTAESPRIPYIYIRNMYTHIHIYIHIYTEYTHIPYIYTHTHICITSLSISS